MEDKSEKNIYFCTRRVELNYAHDQIHVPMFHRQRYNHVPFCNCLHYHSLSIYLSLFPTLFLSPSLLSLSLQFFISFLTLFSALLLFLFLFLFLFGNLLTFIHITEQLRASNIDTAIFSLQELGIDSR